MNLARHANKIIKINPNMMIPYYLMASYAYYEESDPIFSDSYFDNLAKNILKEWDNLDHYHKHLLDRDVLEAGSYIGKYPTIVIDSLDELKKGKNNAN
tara:strand:+ start:25224 stop:25517 length:294 start_codon:yes stop_codon:yes gene_type:complete